MSSLLSQKDAGASFRTEHVPATQKFCFVPEAAGTTGQLHDVLRELGGVEWKRNIEDLLEELGEVRLEFLHRQDLPEFKEEIVLAMGGLTAMTMTLPLMGNEVPYAE
uniref:Phosphoenolpyruvate carboxylase n=1 Tax=Caenorhabditis tropicalis TaxID=1561998 RepID=A0A1I7TTU6_9PELO